MEEQTMTIKNLDHTEDGIIEYIVTENKGHQMMGNVFFGITQEEREKETLTIKIPNSFRTEFELAFNNIIVPEKDPFLLGLVQIGKTKADYFEVNIFRAHPSLIFRLGQLSGMCTK